MKMNIVNTLNIFAFSNTNFCGLVLWNWPLVLKELSSHHWVKNIFLQDEFLVNFTRKLGREQRRVHSEWTNLEKDPRKKLELDFHKKKIQKTWDETKANLFAQGIGHSR